MVKRLLAAAVLLASTVALAQVSPALRSYCLRIENELLTVGRCFVLDDIGVNARMCVDEDCNCLCDGDEAQVAIEGCDTEGAVLYYDNTLNHLACEAALTYAAGTNTLTVGTITASGLTVGGQNVCLADGTNCELQPCGVGDELLYSDGLAIDCTARLTYDEPTSILTHADVSTTTEQVQEYFAPYTTTGLGTENYGVRWWSNTNGNNYIDTLVASDGDIIYQPCCTTGNYCVIPSANCPASSGMQVLGDLRVRGANGDDGVVYASAFLGFSPTKTGDPLWICTDPPTCANYVELDNNSNDLVITPTGGDTTVTGTLKVDGTLDVTVTDDADLSYTTASGSQPLVTHDKAGFATPPYSVVLNATADSVATYAMGGMSFDGKQGAAWSVTWGNASTLKAAFVINGKFEALGDTVGGGGNAGTYQGYNIMETPVSGGDYMRFHDGLTTLNTQIGEINSDGTNMAIWWGSAGTPDCTLYRSAADTLDLTGCDLNLDDQLQHDGAVVTIPFAYTTYIERSVKSLDHELFGGFNLLSSGVTIANGSPTTPTGGLAKIFVVLNTCSDSAGSITVTGTSVDRNTGAETGSDTDTLTISGVTTDTSDTSAGGNTRHAFSNAYITSKWFKGNPTLSTTDINCTDVDIYNVAFDQTNDENTTINTLDVTAQAASTTYLEIYLYRIVVTGDTAVVTRDASMELSSSVSGEFYRLRRGNLALANNGADGAGFWIDMHPGSTAVFGWEDITTFVWFDKELF